MQFKFHNKKDKGFENSSTDLHTEWPRIATRQPLRTYLHTEANLAKLHYRLEQHTLNFMKDDAQVPSNLQLRSKLAVKTRSSTKVLFRV